MKNSCINTSMCFLLLCLFLFIPFGVTGQSAKSLTGKVVDEFGDILPGVTIRIKGTSVGTISDNKGDFSIRIANSDMTLVFSCVGMATQEVKPGKQTNITVKMMEDRKLLDEVVVVGYGQTKKSDLTGSLSSISKDVLSNRIITSLEDAMKGKAAGMQIIQNDGAPGSEFTIRIRGASSINASSTPLFVIDGVLCDDASDVNPGDVESIEVLKDASSTAIYGSRGANGVIIITTKGGFDGKTKVEFYGNIGFQSATRPYDLMNSREYAEMRYKTSWQYMPYSQAGTATGINWLNSASHNYYRDSTEPDANYWRISTPNSFSNYESYADSVSTDWQDAMFRKALFQEYRLTVSGGSATNKFSVMANYLNQDGIVVYSGFEKFSGRINFEQNLSSKIKFLANVSGSRSVYDGLATGTSDGVTTSMLRQIPIKALDDNDQIYEEDGADANMVSTNPYYQAQNITKDRFRHNITARANLEYKINKNWMVRINGTYVYNNSDNNTFYPKTVAQGVKQKGRAILERSSSTKLLNENLLYYNTTIKKIHKIKVLGGMTIEKYVDNYLLCENQNFQVENLGSNSIGQGITPIVPESSSARNPYQMVSFLGRAEYGFSDRYLMTATFRADGSSRFGANNKWGYFPSVAVAWRASEESFLKDQTWLSNLKVRLSVGQSGNTAIPAFRSLPTISTAFAPMDGQNPSYGVVINNPQNNSLRWETTTQYDGGIDFAVLNNRLSFIFDLYLKNTTDLLLQRNTPYYSGYKKAWANVGDVQNRGLEFTVNAQLIETRNWFWNFDFNIGLNRSKVLNIPGDELMFDPGVVPGSGNLVLIRSGERLGQWYGYKVNGIYGSQKEIDALPDDYEMLSIKKKDIRPGDRRYVNMNGDNVINADDKTILGKGEADFSGGFSSSFGYKGFAVNVLFQYSYGADVFNANMVTLDAGRDAYNQTTHLNNSWTPTLYDGNGNLFYQGNPDGKYRMPGGGPENNLLSDFIEDGSFLRLSDVTVSYTFNRKTVSKMKLTGLKIFASGKNLFVLTKYYGFDPEVNTRQGGLGDIMPSLDYGSYPRSMAFSMGVNVSF